MIKDLPKMIFAFSPYRKHHFAVILLCLLGFKSHAQNPADLCSAALSITPTIYCTSTAYTLPGTYTYEGTASSCATGNMDDGWFTFTAQSSNYIFQLTGDYTHTAALYSGTCGALTLVTCDNATAGNTAILAIKTVPGTNYFIQVHRNSGTTTSTMTGTYTLCNSAPGGVKSSMKAWYKAGANVVKSGTTVTGWNSEIGNVNFTDVSGVPTYNPSFANWNPAVLFDGTAYLHNLNVLGSDLLSSTNNTVFLVAKSNADGILLKWDQNQSSNRLGFESKPAPTYLRLDHPGDLSSKSGGVTGQWNVMAAATTTGTDDFIVNGITVDSGPGGSNNTTLTAPLSMSGDLWSGHRANSEITEAIFYATTLTATELIKVQSYLGVKYGISLGTNDSPVSYRASNNTIIWPANTTDQNDIAGIGRDDASSLSQLKSKSINNDDIVTMALVDAGGSFASPNAFDNNLEFELWGNNNGEQPSNVLGGGLTETTVECPSSILRRLGREWHVVETGTIGDVALTFDLTGIPVMGSTFYDFRLLIDLDKDGDFNTGTIRRITPSSYSGNIVTFNNVDFNSDEIFTLATLVPSPGGVSTGLQIWLRASQLTSTTTNNAQLNTWYNAGSSNFDFSRIWGSTSGWPRFRTKAVNFNHAIEFGSSGAMISENNAVNMRPSSNNSTSMVVFQTTQNAGTTDFWASPNFVTTETYYTGRDYGFGMKSGKMGLKVKNGEAWDAFSNTSYNDNIPHVAAASRTRSGVVTNPSTVSIQVDGITDVTATSVGDSYALDASDATGMPFKGTGIGGGTVTGWDVYNSMQYVGLLPEVIVFNNVISGVNLNKVNSYLAIKYGLTLGDITTPVSYLNSYATVVWTASTTYQHDIVAIGRDDRSQLDQRRSISVETDNMLDLALVDNGGTQATPNSFNSDLEFFITGNNNGTRAFNNTSDVDGLVIINRLSRVWKVQETGAIGNIVVAIDLSSIPTAINGAELRLLIDRDNDGFADNDVAPKAVDSYNAASKIAYFTTDMQSGDLFTIGTAISAALPVEFINIAAAAEPERNKITWNTATEINNSRFVVQRMTQANQWDSIGTLPGANNSNTVQTYTFYDHQVEHLSFAYYRVVQYDYDGKSEASKIVYVDRASFLNTNDLIKIGPNPSDGLLEVTINNELFASTTHHLAVYSILGIKVYDSTLDRANSAIDLRELASGNYILELTNSSGTSPVYEKIVIKHQ